MEPRAKTSKHINSKLFLYVFLKDYTNIYLFYKQSEKVKYHSYFLFHEKKNKYINNNFILRERKNYNEHFNEIDIETCSIMKCKKSIRELCNILLSI